MTGARVGIVGHGAIGADLRARLAGDGHEIVVLLRPDSPRRGAVGADVHLVDDLAGLLAAAPAIVVEAAGAAALAELAPALLRAGIPVVAASTGALGDPDLHASLAEAARAGRTRLVAASGALGGLDYLGALRGSGAVVRYTSRKPVAAWRAELAAIGRDPARVTGEVVLFEGPPAEAARLYPRNLNAGLTVALAASPVPVAVRVIADPSVNLNTHEIEAEGALGTAYLRFTNAPSAANPKTSALTAASLAATVRRLLEPVVA